MQITKTKLKNILIIKPRVLGDQRGFFFESYNQKTYKEAGIKYNFVQDNLSKSQKGVIRGLHYQKNPFSQGKLIQVIKGAVLDVALDIRFGSPTFGEHVAVELNEENKKQLWIPPGFAHGFATLSDVAIFSYKCTDFYSHESEGGIIWNDPDLVIDWKVENPIISDKDQKLLRLKDIDKDFKY